MQLLLAPAAGHDAVVRPEIFLGDTQLRRLDASMGIVKVIDAMDMLHVLGLPHLSDREKRQRLHQPLITSSARRQVRVRLRREEDVGLVLLCVRRLHTHREPGRGFYAARSSARAGGQILCRGEGRSIPMRSFAGKGWEKT